MTNANVEDDIDISVTVKKDHVDTVTKEDKLVKNDTSYTDDDDVLVSPQISSEDEYVKNAIKSEFTEDASGRCVDFLSGDPEQLGNWLYSQLNGLSDEELKEKMSDSTSWLYRIYQMSKIYSESSEAKRLQDFAKEEDFKDKENFSDRLVRDGKILTGLAKFDSSVGKTTKLKGLDAYRKIVTKGSIFRYTLYNSGIAVEFREPTLSELNSFVQQTKQVESNYGYMFGNAIQLFTHVFITQSILKLLYNCIVFSTYNKFRDEQDFFSKISIHDLSPLLASFAKTIYPDGFDGFSKTCLRNVLNTEDGVSCKHVAKIKANISKLFYTRYYKLSEDNFTYLSGIRETDKTTKDPDRIAYVKSITVPRTISIGEYKFTLRSPSIQEWSVAGDAYTSKISKLMNTDNASVDSLDSYLLSNRMSQYLCWVEQIDMYVDETQATLEMTTTNKDAILFAFEKTVLINKEYRDIFLKELDSYMNDSQLTFIGYPDDPCPSCGFIDENTTGFVFVDPISSFFTLVILKYLEYTKNTML